MIVLTGGQVHAARMLSLRSMLKLELLGMKRSRSPSAYVIIKRDWGLHGSREAVLQQFEAMLRTAGVLS